MSPAQHKPRVPHVSVFLPKSVSLIADCRFFPKLLSDCINTLTPPKLPPPFTLSNLQNPVSPLQSKAHEKQVLFQCQIHRESKALASTPFFAAKIFVCFWVFYHHTMERRCKKKKKARVARKSETKTQRSLSELPTGILIDIVSRLPIETIFNCRCVCKTWLSLFSSSYFAEIRSQTNTNLMLQPTPTPNMKKNLYFVHLEACDIRHRNAVVKLENKTHVGSPSRVFELENSCHGLVLLRSFGRLYIWNPITSEYIVLPEVKKDLEFKFISLLGFSSKTQQYKVVVIWEKPNFVWDTYIYTLGIGEWRGIECSQNIFRPYNNRAFNVILNEYFHWLGAGDDDSEFICSFDLGNEEFRPVPPPCHFGPYQKSKSHHLSLGVLDRCLSLTEFCGDDHYDIWVMKVYGVQTSWTKEFSFRAPIGNSLWLRSSCQEIGLLNNGEIMMLWRNLVSFNLVKKSFESRKIKSVQHFRAIAHCPSFVSLKDIVKGEDLTVFNTMSRCFHFNDSIFGWGNH